MLNSGFGKGESLNVLGVILLHQSVELHYTFESRKLEVK